MSTTQVRGAFDSDGDPQISRESLSQLDDAPTSCEHCKILFISGMGFFTDAYDLFVIGVVATLVTANGTSRLRRSHCLLRWRCSPRGRGDRLRSGRRSAGPQVDLWL